ncbi:MAG: hypothetical protein P8Y45_06345 [Exilibacterium sp.]
MKLQDNDTYVLNEFGDIDVNYYINKAQRLRNQTIRKNTINLIGLIKQKLHSIGALFYRATPA